ncbi:MAG: zinc-dependent metalloprotease [Actinomycetota bacterium]
MSQEPFGDIPLFREIQKLLAASEGPVNFEIARQIGLAVATQGRADGQPDALARRTYGEAVHAAESLLGGYTRLAVTEPARVDLVGPGWWVRATLEAWKPVLERLAHRFTAQLSGLGGEAEQPASMAAALQQIGPLLMGIQAGTLIGHLAKETLERYDLPIPREDDHLFFVVDNVDGVARNYDLERETFAKWLALHSVAHHITYSAIPWLRPYARNLVTDLIDSIEIDASDLERRFMDLQSQGMEALQQGMGAESAVPIVPTERHRSALDRLRAFLALVEGYAGEATRAVAESLIPDAPRIGEGMARHRASPSEGKQMLATLLGISIDRQLESSGATFCAAITKLKGLPALNRVWEAPDNLPTIEEIRDPFAWIDRVLEGSR